MASKSHGFNEGAHRAKVEQAVRGIPGKAHAGVHGGGAVGETRKTPAEKGYGPVKSGTKGHPGSD